MKIPVGSTTKYNSSLFQMPFLIVLVLVLFMLSAGCMMTWIFTTDTWSQQILALPHQTTPTSTSGAGNGGATSLSTSSTTSVVLLSSAAATTSTTTTTHNNTNNSNHRRRHIKGDEGDPQQEVPPVVPIDSYLRRSKQQLQTRSSSTSTQNHTGSTATNSGILVMVMGQAKNYQHWTRLWNNFLRDENESCSSRSNHPSCSTTASVVTPTSPSTRSFVYASYDKPIHDDTNSSSVTTSNDSNQNYNDTLHTIFIHGTTWTQGRNMMLAEAVRLERHFGKEYKYWVLLDDDVEFVCQDTSVSSNDTLYEHGQFCWNKFLNVLKNDDDLVPQKATTVVVNKGNKYMAHHIAASNADAFVAAFKRDSVPYLLPYATLKEGESQWTSQAVLYCIMWTCLKQSTYFIPFMSAVNGKHRPYQRGRNITAYQRTAIDNYAPYLDVQHCDEEKFFRPKTDILNATTTKELDRLIPDKNLSCDVLKTRFLDWESHVL